MKKQKVFVGLVLIMVLYTTACNGEESKLSKEESYVELYEEHEETTVTPSTAVDEQNNEETINYINEYKAEEGYLAPDFSVQLLDGTLVNLSSFQGTTVILNFWATWCGPCCGELPAFQQLQDEYGSNLTILAINCGEDQSTLTNFCSDNGYTFRIGLDIDGTIGALYPTTGIPYTIIIDPDGVIRHITVGASDANTMYEYYKECIDSM